MFTSSRFPSRHGPHRVRFTCAGKSLAGAVNRDHPGYEVRVTTGPSISIANPGPKPQGVIASIFQVGARADILVSDPGKLDQPPQMKLSFSSAGLEKLKEGVRTGKAQSLISGEFRFGGSSIPLIPPAEIIDGGRLEVIPNAARVPEQDVSGVRDGAAKEKPSLVMRKDGQIVHGSHTTRGYARSKR